MFVSLLWSILHARTQTRETISGRRASGWMDALSLEGTDPPSRPGSARRNAQQQQNVRLRGQLDNRRDTVLSAVAPNDPEALTN